MNSTSTPRRLHRAWRGSVALTFLLALILTFFAHPAKAFTEDQGHNLKAKPSTWCQWCADSDFGYDPNEERGMITNAGATMGEAACGNFSFAFVELRAGVKARGSYTVNDMRAEAIKLMQAGKDSPFSDDGWLYQLNPEGFAQGVSNMTGGQLTVEVQGDTSGAGLGANKFTEDDVRQAMNDGYFVIFMVQTDTGGRHWIAGDYVEGNTVHTIDSGRPLTTLDRSQYPGGIGPILKFSRTDGKKLQDLPTIDDAATSVGSSNSGDTTTATDTGIISDLDLPGMPPRTVGQNHQLSEADKLAFAKDTLKFANYTNLNTTQKDNVDQIVAQRQLEQNSKLSNGFSTGAAIIGIILFLYALVIVLAFLFDLAFPLFSLLKTVTGGSLTVHHESQSRVGVKELGAPPRGRWATWGNVFATAGLVAALGGLLISGTLVRWVASLWQMLYM